MQIDFNFEYLISYEHVLSIIHIIYLTVMKVYIQHYDFIFHM